MTRDIKLLIERLKVKFPDSYKEITAKYVESSELELKEEKNPYALPSYIFWLLVLGEELFPDLAEHIKDLGESSLQNFQEIEG